MKVENKQEHTMADRRRANNPAVTPLPTRTRTNSHRWVVALASVAILLLMLMSRRQEEMGQFLETNAGNPSTPSDPTSLLSTNDKPIRQIGILGERNSGTRWTYEYVYSLLGACRHGKFPLTLPLSRTTVRPCVLCANKTGT
jgi:hypothetical protein